MTARRVTRGAIAALGVLLVLVGIWHLAGSLHHFRQWVSLAEWLVAAVILHDGGLVPLLELLSRGWRPAGGQLTELGRGAVSVGFLVGVFLTGAAIPSLVAQHKGPRNPTVVPQDYALHLAALWAVIIVCVAGTAWLSLRRESRSGGRRRPIR